MLKTPAAEYNFQHLTSPGKDQGADSHGCLQDPEHRIILFYGSHTHSRAMGAGARLLTIMGFCTSKLYHWPFFSSEDLGKVISHKRKEREKEITNTEHTLKCFQKVYRK